MGQALQVIGLRVCGEQRWLQGAKGRRGRRLRSPGYRVARPGWGWPLTGASPVEALHQLGDVVSEEALAEHDAHVSVAALVQHIRGLGHEQGETVGRSGAQLCISQQAQQLRGREP